MNEKPLTLRHHEVKQLLDSGEVLLVRPVKPPPPVDATDVLVWEAPELPASVKAAEGLYCHCPDGLRFLGSCPYPVGSRLWVRETWVQPYEWIVPGYDPNYRAALYKASSFDTWGCGYEFHWDDIPDRFWRPAITMPRWASRITLEVTGLTAERAWEISYVDTVAEGYPDPNHPYNARVWHAALWDTINARRGYPWISNPWVWSTRVRRVQ